MDNEGSIAYGNKKQGQMSNNPPAVTTLRNQKKCFMIYAVALAGLVNYF